MWRGVGGVEGVCRTWGQRGLWCWPTKAKESLALELLQPELWQVWRGWHHFPRGIGAWAGSHSEVAVCGEGWAGWRGCAGPGDREASAWPLWTWC